MLIMKTSARASGLFDRVMVAARDDPAIQVITSKFFEEDESQYYPNAAEVAALPFREAMTFESAIQVLGFDLSVVLSRRGCMGDLIDETMGGAVRSRPGWLVGRGDTARLRDRSSCDRPCRHPLP